jgi:hypothetical protein
MEFVRSPQGDWLPKPLGKRALVAAGHGKIHLALGDSSVVEHLDPRGGGSAATKFTSALRSPSRENIEIALDAMVGPATGATRDSIRARLRMLETPARLPACSALFADSLGSVWIVTSFPGDGKAIVRTIAGGKAGEGSVELPGEQKIMDVDGDRILSLKESPSGDLSVAVLRVTREP